jgi:large subunit ribosomal protein L1
MAEKAKKKKTKAKALEVEADEQPVEETVVVEAEATEAPEPATEVAEAEAEPKQEEKATAKAGKRSAKALKENEEKVAKEERKVETAASEEDKPKKAVTPTRSRLDRRGKKFRKAAEQIEKDKVYPLSDALELATKTSPAKFDASVELHINLSVDPRHADQNVRDSLVLPAGTGKVVKVAVFADADGAAKGKKAGADITGEEDIIKLLDKGQFSFDILVATPSHMPKLGKYARILGPRGLMPNPKSGTVTTDIVKAVSEAKAGRVEYRVDSTGIVHLSIGKVSFGRAKLEENAHAVLTSIRSNKPASVKSAYIKAIHLTTTMGPSISVEPNEQLA